MIPRRPAILFVCRLLLAALVLLLITGAPLQNAAAWPESASQVLTVAISEAPASLDPAIDLTSAMPIIAGQVFDTLVVLSPEDATPQPALSQSWTVSADGKTWMFTLRSGVKFHDGTVLDAAAVLFNFERWWDPANAYHDPAFNHFNSTFGFKNDANSLFASLEISSSSLLILHLNRPNNLLPSLLAHPAFSIASPKAIQAGTLASHPVGSGPFQFAASTADTVRLTPFAGYWGAKASYGALVFKAIPSGDDRFSAVQANSVQVAFDVPASHYSQVAANSSLRAIRRKLPDTGYLGINQNVTPLSLQPVRQAIAHAIDKAALISGHFGPLDEAAVQLLPPEIFGYDPALVDYAYDPIMAKALLAQAGYANGFTVTLKYRPTSPAYLPNPAATAAAIKTDLAAVNITVDLMEENSTDFINDVFAGNTELFLFGWSSDYLHPSSFFSILCGSLGAQFGKVDALLCDDLNSAIEDPANSDDATQETLYKDFSKHVWKELPFVPLAHGRGLIVARFGVSGLKGVALGDEAFETVTLPGSARVLLPLVTR